MAQTLTIRVVGRGDLMVPAGITVRELLDRHLESGPSEALGAMIDEVIVGLDHPIIRDRLSLRLITLDTPEALEMLRNTAVSILAHAVKELYPDSSLGFGTAEPDGFHRDFLADTPFTWEDLAKIEERMRELAEEDLPILGRTVSRFEGLAELGRLEEHLLLEYLEGIESGEVRFDQCGEFRDLSRRPLLESTGRLKHFKLLSLSTSFWMGDENRHRLQRIGGTAFFSFEDLDAFLRRNEARLKRDHRRLGSALSLFAFAESNPAGMPTWLPAGELTRMALKERLHSRFQEAGFLPVGGTLANMTNARPVSEAKNKARRPVGLADDGSYSAEIRTDHLAAALNTFESLCRTHRDLPLRLYEISPVMREEPGGTLHGLFRTREITLAQVPVFCGNEGLGSEFRHLLEFSRDLLEWFGFSIEIELKPGEGGETVSGADSLRNFQDMLDACGDSGLRCHVEEPGPAPLHLAKFKLDDGMGRTWTHSWIMLHYGVSAEAGLSCVDAEEKRAAPLLLVANVPGPLERLLGILLEKCNGELPFWLAPRQIVIIPITRKETAAAADLARLLSVNGWRSEADLRQESMGAKIRRAELNKVPMMVILGKREVASGTASLRTRDKGVIGEVDPERLLVLARDELKRSLQPGFGVKLVDDESE